jgi:hypothetical protein
MSDFDFLYYLKRKSYLLPVSYRWNSAYKLDDAVRELEQVSGQSITAGEVRRLLERNHISDAPAYATENKVAKNT